MNDPYLFGICIVQLVFFFPGLQVGCYLCWKQGLKAVASCWRFVVILAWLRVTSAAYTIAAIYHPKEWILIVVIVCDLLGVAPLTLACVGLLQRVNQTTHQLSSHFYGFVSVISLVGLGLGIAGAIKAVHGDGADTSYNVTGMLEAALSLFLACYVLMLIALVIYTRQWKKALLNEPNERRIVAAAWATAPFMLVRYVYACIGDFSNDPRFAFYGGNNTIFLFMSVLMEIAILCILLYTGLKVPPPPATVGGPKLPLLNILRFKRKSAETVNSTEVSLTAVEGTTAGTTGTTAEASV